MGATVSTDLLDLANRHALVVELGRLRPSFDNWRALKACTEAHYVGMLFRPEMAKAIAEGAKTQTRRGITAHNALKDGHPTRARHLAGAAWDRAYVDEGPSPAGNAGPYLHVPFPGDETTHRIYSRVMPGAVLWARETWAPNPLDDRETLFNATTTDPGAPGKRMKWRSPLHLPQVRARFLLVVVDVTPSRLETIDDVDALAEGVRPKKGEKPRDAFVDLWHRVHGPGAWERDKRAWVWRYRFARVVGTGRTG